MRPGPGQFSVVAFFFLGGLCHRGLAVMEWPMCHHSGQCQGGWHGVVRLYLAHVSPVHGMVRLNLA